MSGRRPLLLSGALGLLVALAAGSSPARAQDAPARPAEEASTSAERDDPASRLPPGFQPIRGKEESAQVDPNPLVVGAYGAIFLGLFIYVIWMVRRQGQLAREVADLARRMEKPEP